MYKSCALIQCAGVFALAHSLSQAALAQCDSREETLISSLSKQESFRPAERSGMAAFKHNPEGCPPVEPANVFAPARTPVVPAGSLDGVMLVPGQDPARDYVDPAILTLQSGDILIAYSEWGYPATSAEAEEHGLEDPEYHYAPWSRPPRVFVIRSFDGGTTWSEPLLAGTSTFQTYDLLNLSMVQTDGGRILIVSELPPPWERNFVLYSDDDGFTWSQEQVTTWEGLVRFMGPVDGNVWLPLTNADTDTIEVFTSEDGLTWSETPEIRIPPPDAGYSKITLAGILELPDGTWLAAVEAATGDVSQCLWDEPCGNILLQTFLMRSTDRGAGWNAAELLPTQDTWTYGGRLRMGEDGVLWYAFQNVRNPEWYWCGGFPEGDIFYTTSADAGLTWTPVERFTRYVGADFLGDLTLSGNDPLLVFTSTRFLPTPWSDNVESIWESREVFGWARKGMVWLGSPGLGVEQPGELPPVARFGRQWGTNWGPNEPITVNVEAYDESGIATVTVRYALTERDGNRYYPFDPGSSEQITLFDDGQHEDGTAGDGLWGGTIPGQDLRTVILMEAVATDDDGNTVSSRGGKVAHTYGCGNAWADVFIDPVHSAGKLIVATRTNGGFGSTRVGGSPHQGDRGLMQWPGPNGQNYAVAALPVATAATDSGMVSRRLFQGPEFPGLASDVSDLDITHRGHYRSAYGATWAQRSFQWAAPDREDFIIVDYELTNQGDKGRIDSIWVGIYMDPEVTLETTNWDDQVGYDERSNVLYAYDSGEDCRKPGAYFACPPGYLGLAALRNDGVPSAAAFIEADPQACLSCGLTPGDPRVSGGIDPALQGGASVPPRDYTVMLTDGPQDISVGESARFAFGFVMGDGLEDMLANAEVMRSVYASEIAPLTFISSEAVAPLASTFELSQNYPNPFRARSTISFTLPNPERVRVTLYNLLGERVAGLLDEDRPRGRHSVSVDASGLAGGLYVYRLEAGSFAAGKKLIIIK